MNNKSFFISSNTCSFGELLEKNSNYIIPIFQRPYSWEYEQIERFIGDIFESFWGIDKQSKSESFFAGTIQISNPLEIIDGQQRLTSLLLLQKVFDIIFHEDKTIKFIETRVNNGSQEKQLLELLKIKTLKQLERKVQKDQEEEVYNTYIQNSAYIYYILQEQINNFENFQTETKDLFEEFLKKQVFFVLIETKTSLSKTLKIFDTINTAGMDLNVEDLFKIRMYDYLKSKTKKEKGIFEEISILYEKIEEANLKHAISISMDYILSIYQAFLISKYDLPNELFEYTTDIFFERLFDTLLGNKTWKNFSSVKKSLELSLDDIEKIIEIVIYWFSAPYITKEEMLVRNLIYWGRYSRHDNIFYLFLLNFWKANNKKKVHTEILSSLILLNKLFVIYSLYYDRAVSDIHTFVFNLSKKIFEKNTTIEVIKEEIQNKIRDFKNSEDFYYFDFVLKGPIYYSARKRNLMCLLSAYFEERKDTSLEKKLFETAFDIEHIHATADETKEVSEDLQNSIGNLMLLERYINRSIGKKKFSEKKKQYCDSIYKFAKDLANSSQYKWSEKDIIKRRDSVVTKVIKYLFKSV